MPPAKAPTRAQQPATSGLGLLYTSPQKRRNRKKTTTYVQPLGLKEERQRLLEKLARLKQPKKTPEIPANNIDIDVEASLEEVPTEATILAEPDPFATELPQFDFDEHRPTRRVLPDQTANHLYNRWAEILPRLVSPLLTYVTKSTGQIPDRIIRLETTCRGIGCTKRTHEVLCLFQDYFERLNLISCQCEDLLHILVSNGLFPTSPTSPRVAVSIHLLDFYHALFERSCDAVNAMASALNTFYTRRGFILLNKKGVPVQDAFRRGLGQAVQWYDNLQLRLEQRIEEAILMADCHIQQTRGTPQFQVTPPIDHPGASGIIPEPHHLALPNGSRAGQCARVLQQRCPACFGGLNFGRSLDNGGDINVCLDGNFNHRHLKSAGECPKFYHPEYMLSKEQVDTIGQHIESLRKTRPRNRQPRVPDEAVDECESSHTAGSGANTKTNMDKFDDSGLMALVCRHDIPLFLANIDTPGEQQKYGIALLLHLFSLLPPNATVVTLYDVGCVLERSLELYDFIPSTINTRLGFATSAMHAYVHQWACQLVYNPRIRKGLGLTDGEGVERLWSRLRKLIGVARSSARSRRIWMIDRQAHSIALELRDDLGNWIHRRLTKGVGIEGQTRKAHATLAACDIPLEVLREQWQLQKSSQLSVRAHAPIRLKKELDTVLTLQGDLDSVDVTIQSTRATLSKSAPSRDSMLILSALQETHEHLKDKVEALYASLNVQDSFPELRGIDLDFVRTLLMARDLKINIRKRAIGSFFEWDKLDQATGGRDQAIGTKVHQATRKAISKRKPALMAGIRKFNTYCATLASLYKPEWNIPLPQPLPTKLAPLRDATHLMEDVWITRSTENVPRWLEDLDVREGIRAMLKLDRCLEERRRLGTEADNICRWFGRELSAVELALSIPANVTLRIPLQQRRIHLLNLKPQWVNPLASSLRFDAHVDTAAEIARSMPPMSVGRGIVRNTRLYDIPLLARQEVIDDEHENETETPPPVHIETDEVLMADYIAQEANDDGMDLEEGDLEVPEINLSWSLPNYIQSHDDLLEVLQFRSVGEAASTSIERVLHHSHGRIFFGPRELDIMKSPDARLNDVCLNGIATLLHQYFATSTMPTSDTSRQCALFTTFDLPMVQYNASDADFWRRTHRLEYWSRKLWILPIHRARSEHWVMCTIVPERGEVHLFDSYGARDPWKHEVKEIMCFVMRLIVLANRNGHPLPIPTTGWSAYPVLMYPRQTNGVDCGIWVLANIAAVLCGFPLTGLVEGNMNHLRKSLLQHILALPSVVAN